MVVVSNIYFNANYWNMPITPQYLSGFLNDALIKKVQQESNVEWAKTPNGELKPMKLPKSENLSSWINFAKTTLLELLP